MNNYTLWWFVQPTHLAWFALLLGLTFRGRGRARWLLGLGGGALLLFAFSPLADWAMRPLEMRFSPMRVPQPAGIIVLAGAEQAASYEAWGEPHFNGFADRLTSFVILAQRYPKARLIHSGGGHPQAGVALNQSDTARAFLLSAGIGADRIMFEADSRNTYEAARELSVLLGEEARAPWLLVTSAFHMPRAIGSFRTQGINALPWPTDYTQHPEPAPALPQPARNLERLDWAAHEWLGLAYYRLHGYTQELFPRP